MLVPGFVSHLELDWADPRHAAFLDRLGLLGRLIRFDKRGTGMSDRPNDVPDLETRMHDVLSVMEAAGSGRAVLFGYSEGGPMATLMAAVHPERVEALVLYGAYAARKRSSDYPLAPTLEQRREYADRLAGEWSWEADMRLMAPSADDAMARWWGQRARAAATPSTVRSLIAMNTLIDVRDALGSVRLPTLVMHRRGDQDSSVDEGRYLAEHIPGARFVELAGAHHFVAVDANQILDQVESFLADLGPAPAPPRALGAVLAVAGPDAAARSLPAGRPAPICTVTGTPRQPGGQPALASTVTGTPLVSMSKTADRLRDWATSPSNCSGLPSPRIAKLTLMPWKPLRTPGSRPRMPRRSMSPSTVDVTSVSGIPRAAAMFARPLVRQAARACRRSSTGVGPWSVPVRIGGWSASYRWSVARVNSWPAP